MHVLKNGVTVAFDVDDTLVCWDTPEDMEDKTVTIYCDGKECNRVPNPYNLNLLKKFSESGHTVIVWSASGVKWAEAVVKCLGLEQYVDLVMSKLTYYIDDIKDPAHVLGKHGFFDMEGNKYGHQAIFNQENK
jgi:hydroxymethylpyrimidine pyrophosphatase-like HAD family hydrolase